MKTKLSIILSLVVGIAIVSLAADLSGGKPPAPDQTAIQELRAQITELRAKVQRLESQTKNLESTVDQLKRSPMPSPLNLQVNPAAPASPQNLIPSPTGSRPPTVWGEREVNGWTFYLVPCNERTR